MKTPARVGNALFGVGLFVGLTGMVAMAGLVLFQPDLSLTPTECHVAFTGLKVWVAYMGVAFALSQHTPRVGRKG